MTRATEAALRERVEECAKAREDADRVRVESAEVVEALKAEINNAMDSSYSGQHPRATLAHMDACLYSKAMADLSALDFEGPVAGCPGGWGDDSPGTSEPESEPESGRRRRRCRGS